MLLVLVAARVTVSRRTTQHKQLVPCVFFCSCSTLHTVTLPTCALGALLTHRLVSNLDFKVTDEDVKELFGTVGTIKESYIHYDKK